MKQAESTRLSRRLFAIAGLSAGATLLARCPLFADNKTEPAHLPTSMPGTNTSFGSLKQVEAGVLNVGYAEAGPTNGPVVLLLHGWPYDIHSFVEVTPLLAS